MDITIAQNRFGLGGKPGEPVGGDPRRWLLDQFGRYNPRPETIAAAPDHATAADAVIQFIAARGEVSRAGRMPPQGGRTNEMQRGRAPAEEMTPELSAPGGNARVGRAPASQTAGRPARAVLRGERENLQSVYQSSVTARANAALASNTPFVERMVHFWANHFAISTEKLVVLGFAGAFEFDAIRPHVLGRFSDMLAAVERHPAMLMFLDQDVSIGPNSPAGSRAATRGKQRGLNENLAREIMELHTLGVRTGYSQGDVTELARALTGWTVGGLGRGPGRQMRARNGPGGFVFARAIHEPGSRTLLGKSFPQQGEDQGAAMLDMLAKQPATAKHIATKLARHFAGDEPPPSLVARLQQAFSSSDGDLPTVYRALIDAPEAWAAKPVKFKTPWEWSISAARAIDADGFPASNVPGFIGQLGQQVWRPGSPAGFDDVAASWAGPDAVMRRVDAAERLVGRDRSQIDARSTARALLGDRIGQATQTAIARAESPGQALALLLVSPEFMRR